MERRRKEDLYYSETGMDQGIRLRDSLLPTIVSIAMYILCATRRAGGGNLAYLALPFIGMCVPLLIELWVFIRVMLKTTDYTERQKSALVDRGRAYTLAVIVMSAWATVSRVIYIIFDRTDSLLTEEIIFLLACMVICGLHSFSYFSQKKHVWEKR